MSELDSPDVERGMQSPATPQLQQGAPDECTGSLGRAGLVVGTLPGLLKLEFQLHRKLWSQLYFVNKLLKWTTLKNTPFGDGYI